MARMVHLEPCRATALAVISTALLAPAHGAWHGG
jgi:hypothetical protein